MARLSLRSPLTFETNQPVIQTQKLPMNLDSGLNSFLALWGGFCASGHISYAKLVPPFYAANLKGKTASQKLGLRFERKVLAKLTRRDFTENLSNFLAAKETLQLRCVNSITGKEITSYFQVNKNQIKKSDFLILHNPNFNFTSKNKNNLCIPDILIFIPKRNRPSPKRNFCVNNVGSVSRVGPIGFVGSISLSPYLDSIFLPTDYDFIICVEVKLTYVDIAFEKLKKLYLPVVSQTFGLPVVPLVIVKNLTSFSPKSTSILSEALSAKIPLLHYLGDGSIF
jgi:hypothetical protein